MTPNKKDLDDQLMLIGKSISWWEGEVNKICNELDEISNQLESSDDYEKIARLEKQLERSEEKMRVLVARGSIELKGLDAWYAAAKKFEDRKKKP